MNLDSFLQLFGKAETHALKNVEVGTWRIKREIYKGDFQSSVYEVEKMDSRSQKYAMKWPVDRREVDVLQALNEPVAWVPGLPRLHDTGNFDGKPYLVMDLMGDDLSKVFGQVQGLALTDKWAFISNIGRMVLRRLEAMHRAGYVHNDVAPYNVLLGPSLDALRRGDRNSAVKADDEVGQVTPYLVDFGCVRPFPDGGPTPANVGSMEFSSRRSADGGERQPSDDIEALGWMMVHATFGVLPWVSELQEFYKLTAIAQKVKMPSLVKAVQRAKSNLLERGWHVCSAEYRRHYEAMPEPLNSFMQACRFLPEGEIGHADYKVLATILGSNGKLSDEEVEAEDTRQFRKRFAELVSYEQAEP